MLLDRLARQWYDEGKLASAYEDLPFGRQLSQVLGEAAAEPSSYQHLEISLPQTDVTETTPIHLGPRGLQSPQKSQTSGRCRVIRRTRDLFESRTARTHQTARENAARGPGATSAFSIARSGIRTWVLWPRRQMHRISSLFGFQ